MHFPTISNETDKILNLFHKSVYTYENFVKRTYNKRKKLLKKLIVLLFNVKKS